MTLKNNYQSLDLFRHSAHSAEELSLLKSLFLKHVLKLWLRHLLSCSLNKFPESFSRTGFFTPLNNLMVPLWPTSGLQASIMKSDLWKWTIYSRQWLKCHRLNPYNLAWSVLPCVCNSSSYIFKHVTAHLRLRSYRRVWSYSVCPIYFF